MAAQDTPATEIAEFLDLVDGVAVTSPLVSGVIPYNHPRNMTVGGSKGSLCGNHAMENGDLLVALGTRFVCQSDSSRTNYPNVRQVISINADIEPLMHYNKTIALAGDVAATLVRLIEELKRRKINKSASTSAWYSECHQKKREWESFKAERYAGRGCTTRFGKRKSSRNPRRSRPPWIGPGRTTLSPSLTRATCKPTAFRSSKMTGWARPSPRRAELHGVRGFGAAYPPR